ncbi:hypothetical protein HYX17_03760 [Candidatus Woesearchaeota archaeon]|nr:hypothetical protein [Candidatus Woesearchaeota archaeon]
MFEFEKNKLILDIKNFHKELGRRPTKHDSSILYNHSKKYFGSWNNMMKSAGYDVRYNQYPIIPLELTSELSYFIGLLITDGHIRYDKLLKNYKIAIYTSYPEEKEMILKLIKYLFNYNSTFSSRINGFNKKPNYEIRINSRELATFLIKNFDMPSGNKSSIVIVPSIIEKSNIELKKAFLRGVIDGDGSILVNNVKIASGSIKFLEGIKRILSELDINCGKIIRDNKLTNTFSIRICRGNDLKKIKKIYDSSCFYRRKKENIDKFYK